MKELTMSREGLNKLEEIAARVNELKALIGLAKKLVWQDALCSDAQEEQYKALFEVGCLVNVLLDCMTLYEGEIDGIICSVIHPDKAGEQVA